MIADVITGQIMHVIQVETPIGLFHMKEKNTTFVSCKGDKGSNHGGIVYAINVNTRKVETGQIRTHSLFPRCSCLSCSLLPPLLHSEYLYLLLHMFKPNLIYPFLNGSPIVKVMNIMIWYIPLVWWHMRGYYT